MISLTSLLQEVHVKPKKPFGTIGMEHSIYQSSKNPNRLYKVGSRKSIDTWLDVFKKNPSLFPQVFRVGRVTGLEEEQEGFYVEIERLNTDQVLKEWDLLEETLETIGYLDRDSGHSFDSLLYTKIPTNLKISLNNYNSTTYELFMKWVKFIDRVNKVVLKSGKPYLDVHRYNFGYDSAGNMKCLDI